MKKILFIATGGTISCGQTEEGLAPRLGSAELLSYLPELGQLCEIDAIQPFSLDSTNMSPGEWVRLSELVSADYGSYDGFVIAHGTDTMAYGAAALSCLVQNSAKPIAITGSQLPMTSPNTDAKRNLRDAFLYAVSDGAWGVRIVFGGRIIDGRCAVKLHTREPDAFRSVNCPDMGAVSEEGIVSLTQKPHGGEPGFYSRLDNSVAVIKLIPAAPPSIFDIEGIRAVIVEGFGTGGLPDYGGGEYEKKVAALLNRGVYVIMATQVLFGGSNLSLYRVGREVAEKYGLLEAGGMTTELAVMKAMWALAYSDNCEDFSRLFAAEI